MGRDQDMNGSIAHQLWVSGVILAIYLGGVWFQHRAKSRLGSRFDAHIAAIIAHMDASFTATIAHLDKLHRDFHQNHVALGQHGVKVQNPEKR
jgi:hypothetical protein